MKNSLKINVKCNYNLLTINLRCLMKISSSLMKRLKVNYDKNKSSSFMILIAYNYLLILSDQIII